MGSVRRYLDREIWTVFSGLFRCHNFDNGEIYLGPGEHEITVPTSVAVANVWFSVVDDESRPVCQDEETVIGASPNDGGFVLFAKVSNWVRVEWFASTYELLER